MAVPLPAEGQEPWDVDLNAALTYVDAQTLTEIDRALQAEQDLQDAIEAVPGAASVTAEVNRATAAEATLTTAVTTEATARTAGDATNATAISDEATARTAAVATNAAAIATEITDRTSAISTEATARTTGDTTNATAISNEATARAAAITTEATARSTGDATNATAITDEAAARATAITAAVATETSARTAADTTNANAISAETTARTSADSAVAAAAVAKAGDTMTGPLTLPGDPGAALQAATKGYVDAFASGTIVHVAVVAATTANGTLASAFENGDTLDGVVLATGNRILLKDQTSGAENGVYTVNASGAPTRATAEDSTAELGIGARFFVSGGTVNGGTSWVQSVATPTIGTTPLVFAQSSGTSTVTGGTGITVTGNSVAINLATTVDKATAQTLTNKTMTSPVINTPTGIAKTDVGLGNVDNTSNATERAATATLTNKTLTAPAITTPTGIVKADVGLGNVDNTSNATERAAAATLTNKTLTSPVITTPTGLAKTDVGLANVDNTSDVTKNAAAVTLTNKTLTTPTLTSPVLNTGVSGTAVDIDSTMVANSDTKLPSQKAIKTALATKASSVNPVFTGTMTAPAVAVTGITGAPTPVRIVGGTTGGKPLSGTFALNDMIVDATGTVWICTLAGTVGVTTVPPSPVFVEQGNNNVLFALGAATQYSDGLFNQIPTLVSSDPAKLNITTQNAVTTLDVSGMAPVFPITNRVTTTQALPSTGAYPGGGGNFGAQGTANPANAMLSVPGMGVPLVKNSFYEIEAMVFYVSSTIADLSINFIEPVGTVSGLWVLDGLKLGGTTTDESVRRVAVPWIFPISVGGVTTGTPFLFARLSGTIEVGANDGTLQMTAAQNNVDTTSPTSIWRGSRIKAIKI